MIVAAPISPFARDTMFPAEPGHWRRCAETNVGKYFAINLLKQQMRSFQVVVAAALAMGGTAVATAPSAGADAVAYLLNVTVRPGYNFANADQALAYGHGICDKIARGDGYPSIARDIKADFNTSDEYQATYLIAQAAQELCPSLIWQLRNSAANYVPPPP